MVRKVLTMLLFLYLFKLCFDIHKLSPNTHTIFRNGHRVLISLKTLIKLTQQRPRPFLFSWTMDAGPGITKALATPLIVVPKE